MELNLEKQKVLSQTLHQQIYDCECKPWAGQDRYCSDCEKAVMDFMFMNGAGVLTRDMEMDDLQERHDVLFKEAAALSGRLEKKIKRVEELKAEVKSLKNDSANIIFKNKDNY